VRWWMHCGDETAASGHCVTRKVFAKPLVAFRPYTRSIAFDDRNGAPFVETIHGSSDPLADVPIGDASVRHEDASVRHEHEHDGRSDSAEHHDVAFEATIVRLDRKTAEQLIRLVVW
jgi:hypothetical protein